MAEAEFTKLELEVWWLYGQALADPAPLPYPSMIKVKDVACGDYLVRVQVSLIKAPVGRFLLNLSLRDRDAKVLPEALVAACVGVFSPDITLSEIDSPADPGITRMFFAFL